MLSMYFILRYLTLIEGMHVISPATNIPMGNGWFWNIGRHLIKHEEYYGLYDLML